MVRLALPFSAAALCFIAAWVAHENNALGLRDGLAWATAIFLIIGLTLTVVFTLTRFVMWASRRD